MRPTVLALLLGAISSLTVTSCGGGGATAGGRSGGLAFRARWPQSSAGAAVKAHAAAAADACGGIDGDNDIPADVDAVRVAFKSEAASGDGTGACCVVVRRGSAAFTNRYLELGGLRVGPGVFSIGGFGAGPVPNDAAGELCPTTPADAGVACDASGNPPLYDSGPVNVEIKAGLVTDSGTVCVPAVVSPTPTIPPTATVIPPPTQTAEPRPSDTPTAIPVATSTPTRGVATRSPTAAPPTATPPSPTPGAAPTLTPGRVTYVIGTAHGAAGSTVTVSVGLAAAGFAVYGTDNEIVFAAGVRVAATAAGVPDCTVDPTINKDGTFFVFRPTGCAATACTAVRAFVTGRPGDAVTPITDGAELYTCRVAIANDAPAGSVPLRCVNAEASAGRPGGPSQLVAAGCTDGEIIVAQ